MNVNKSVFCSNDTRPPWTNSTEKGGSQTRILCRVFYDEAADLANRSLHPTSERDILRPVERAKTSNFLSGVFPGTNPFFNDNPPMIAIPPIRPKMITCMPSGPGLGVLFEGTSYIHASTKIVLGMIYDPACPNDAAAQKSTLVVNPRGCESK